MRRTLLSVLALTLLLAQSARCLADTGSQQPAEGTKPVAVVAINSFDEIMADLAFVGEISNNPGLDQQLEGMLKLFTQGEGVNGLDRKRPLGLIVNTDGTSFQPIAFLPVANFKQLLGSLAPVVGEAKEGDNGVYEMQAGPQKVYLKEHDGWACVGQSAEALADLPKEPGKTLAAVLDKYDMAVRIHVGNVPEMYRSLFLDQLKAGIDSIDKNEGETDQAYELRKQVAENQIKGAQKILDGADQLVLGWAIDRTKKNVFLDGTVMAIAGSDMAKQINGLKAGTSAYAGFFSADAAVTSSVIAEIPEDEIQRGVTTVESLKKSILESIDGSDDLEAGEQKQLAKDAVEQLSDAVIATIRGGKMDSVGTANLDKGQFQVLVGAYVVNPSQVEAGLKKLVALGEKKEKDFPKVTFDAASHGDVRFHTLTVPIKDDEKATRILGDKLDCSVGIGKDSVYLAIGPGSIDAAKAAIDRSATQKDVKLSPAQVKISLLPIMRFAESLSPNDQKLKMAVAELEKLSATDNITLEAQPAQDKLTYHLEAEEGVLRLLGQLTRINNSVAGGVPRQE